MVAKRNLGLNERIWHVQDNCLSSFMHWNEIQQLRMSEMGNMKFPADTRVLVATTQRIAELARIGFKKNGWGWQLAWFSHWGANHWMPSAFVATFLWWKPQVSCVRHQESWTWVFRNLLFSLPFFSPPPSFFRLFPPNCDVEKLRIISHDASFESDIYKVWKNVRQ